MKGLLAVSSVALAIPAVFDEFLVFRHPDSLLNPATLSKLHQSVNDGVVDTFNVVTLDAAKRLQMLRNRAVRTVNATLDAGEGTIHAIKATERYPIRIVDSIFGVGEADRSIFSNNVAELVEGEIKSKYRNVLTPLQSAIRMKRFILFPGSPLPGEEDSTSTEEMFPSTEPIELTGTDEVVPLAAVVAPATEAVVAPAAATQAAAVPASGVPSVAFNANFGVPAISINGGNNGAGNGGFVVALQPIAGISVNALAEDATATTSTSTKACIGEVESRTRVYMDHGKMKVQVIPLTTPAPSGAAADAQETAGLDEIAMELLSANKLDAASDLPDVEQIDALVDAMAIEPQDGEAVELTAETVDQLRKQIKDQLKKQLWSEWVDNVVSNTVGAAAGAETLGAEKQAEEVSTKKT